MIAQKMIAAAKGGSSGRDDARRRGGLTRSSIWLEESALYRVMVSQPVRTSTSPPTLMAPQVEVHKMISVGFAASS